MPKVIELIPIGFFREERPDVPGLPSIRSALGRPIPEKGEVLRYLTSGSVLVASPGIGTDVLDEAADAAFTPSILTDGEMAWPDSLPYYVKKYDVGVPPRAVTRMRDRKFVLRSVDDGRLAEMVIAWSRSLGH